MKFPHSGLTASDVTPRIDIADAWRVLKLIEKLRKAGIGHFDRPPAVCIAVFDGPPVKWLVNQDEVEATLELLEAGVASIGKEAKP